MWPDSRLTELFGIEHPIIQAPMLGASTLELALGVGAGGGLGSIACANVSADELRAICADLRGRTGAPFNLNFFAIGATPPVGPEMLARAKRVLQPYYDELGLGPVPDPPPARDFGFGSEIVDALVELRPHVVSFHFGIPDAETLHRLRGAGILLMSSATNVAEAKALASASIDAIIAQGWEAGGHRGSHVPNGSGDGVGTLAPVPRIVDAVDVPVIAAGGIGDGRGIAAAFALGASGVQIGTGFLACPEAATDQRRRQLLRGASDLDTMVTPAISGRCARAMRSRFTVDIAERGEALLGFPTLLSLTEPMLRAAASSDDPISFHLYGQAAALSLEMPARDLMARFVDEAHEVFRRLSGTRS